MNKRKVILIGAIIACLVAIVVIRGVAGRGDKLARWERSRAQPDWKLLDLQDTGEAMFAVYEAPHDEIVLCHNFYKDGAAPLRPGASLKIVDESGSDLIQTNRATKANPEYVQNYGLVQLISVGTGIACALPKDYQGALLLNYAVFNESQSLETVYEQRLDR